MIEATTQDIQWAANVLRKLDPITMGEALRMCSAVPLTWLGHKEEACTCILTCVGSLSEQINVSTANQRKNAMACIYEFTTTVHF